MNGPRSAAVSRRTVLGGALGALGAGALAACSSGSAVTSSSAAAGAPSGGSTASAAPAARKRGGTFRFAGSDASASDGVDPNSASGSSWAITRAMYNGLLWRDHHQQVQLKLAEEFEADPKDQSVWTIRVRDGVEFHHGKTLTADDVVFTINRIMDPKKPGYVIGLMDSVDPKAITKLDDRTIRLKLKYPNSQLKQTFQAVPAAIVPVDFDPAKPVGTGPFKFVSNTPGQRFVAERNPHYFLDGMPYLDRLELVTFADKTIARTNALFSGQIDGLDKIPAAVVKQVQARDGLTTVISQTGAFEPLAMRSGPGDQFEDPRVRLAFKLIAPRQLLVNSIYAGMGGVGDDIGSWPQWDQSIDPSLTGRAQDLERAKQLLAEAGKAGMEVDLRVGDVVPGQVDAANVFAQEAAKIGVKVTVKKVADLATFYSGDDYMTSQFKNDYLYTTTLYNNILYCYLKDGPFNNTGYSNPEMERLFYQALASPEQEYLETMQKISRILVDDGPWLVWGRHDIADAISAAFTGLVPDATGCGFNGYNWEEIRVGLTERAGGQVTRSAGVERLEDQGENGVVPIPILVSAGVRRGTDPAGR